ncbi:MAG: transposase [Gammaproteobacteria bacterium]|nr:transposase [Gammaproteobacteria bacterium]
MSYNTDIRHRRSIRLKYYNYSQNGAYFITLCTHHRQCLFGKIEHNLMLLNQFGEIVRDEWIKSFEIRKEILIDEFVIMPNHFHCIVFISHSVPLKNKDFSRVIGPSNKSIGALISGFKSVVTTKINQVRNTPFQLVWQRNYHEHIIRNEKSLQNIREYTKNNPCTWRSDSLFLDPVLS